MPAEQQTQSSISTTAIRQQWDDFTDLELEWIAGRPHRLIHALVAKLGLSQDEAARQVAEFMDRENSMG